MSPIASRMPRRHLREVRSHAHALVWHSACTRACIAEDHAAPPECFPNGEAALHNDICCLSVFLRSPVPPRLRGRPSHLGVTRLIMGEQRRNPVSPTVFIFGCVALGAVIVFAMVCAYKLGKYSGWREAIRTYAQYEKADITLAEGET